MISEIRLVTQGVTDLERTTKFYRDALGFEIKGEGTFSADDAALAQAWQLPEGLSGTWQIIGPNGWTSSLVRLMSFSRTGERIWGDYERVQDLGHFAVNYRVPNLDRAWADLSAAGAEQRTEPRYWDVFEGVGGNDSQCFDPDGVLLDVFELIGERVDELYEQLDVPCSAVQTMAIHTKDADASKAFYVGLGYNELYDKVLENMGWLTHLPDGIDMRNVNLNKPELSPIGRIELAQYVGYSGDELRSRALPPNIGALSISFETDDLNATSDLVLELGGQAIGGPARLDMDPFGPVTFGTFFGPDGEVLEFYAKA